MGSSDGKESVCNEETQVQRLGRKDSRGEGNGNPLQYSCLGNPLFLCQQWDKISILAASPEAEIQSAPFPSVFQQQQAKFMW